MTRRVYMVCGRWNGPVPDLVNAPVLFHLPPPIHTLAPPACALARHKPIRSCTRTELDCCPASDSFL